MIETDQSIVYLYSDGPRTMIEREVISLRAYPRSKRHRRMITATIDGGLLIAVLLGEHVMPTSARHTFPYR